MKTPETLEEWIKYASEVEGEVERLRNELLAATHVREYYENSASTDRLTGLWNRRAYDGFLEEAFDRANRHGESFSLAILDIDKFKSVNDRYGHEQGDAVLKAVAEHVKGSVRKGDRACRYGGEEFALILPRTEAEQGLMVVDRARSSLIDRYPILKESRGLSPELVTFSGGVASYHKGEDAASLYKNADRALYTAKNTGRNKILLYSPELAV